MEVCLYIHVKVDAIDNTKIVKAIETTLIEIALL